MKNIKKIVLGTVFALSSTLPALADYSQFDLKGTVDNSLSVQVYDSSNTLFSDNDNTTTIPAIQFGKVNTLGQMVPGNIGTGIGSNPVNVFASFITSSSAGRFQPSVGPAPLAGEQLVGGLFAIEAPGGSIRVQVDSMSSSTSNLNVSYTTQAGTPPDLVLSKASVSLASATMPNSNIAIVQAGQSNVPIAGTGGQVTTTPIANGIPGRLGMNIGVLAFNAAGGGTLTNGAFTGRVKFTATP